MPLSSINNFVKLESFSGFLLVIATVLALLCANSAIEPIYHGLLNTLVKIQVGKFSLGKPLHMWVNDGLMAIFFFLIGLELKREILEGQLSHVKKVILPAIAALGGMIVPALIYINFNWHTSSSEMEGWAIPVATDIAFCLGVLALLGKRIPTGLKLFIMALAIFDDIAAIILIAAFYAGDLSYFSILMSLFITLILLALNDADVMYTPIYIFFGVILWLSVLNSGVHATLTGIILAFTIPLQSRKKESNISPLRNMERKLHPWVAYLILPLFAFTNAGIPLIGLGWGDLFSSVPLGVALGLFIGKQLGVFSFAWVAIKMKLAKLPDQLHMGHLYGGAVLCGIGFTMSIFISSLAFEHNHELNFANSSRLGIFVGSLLSALLAYFILRYHGGDETEILPTKAP